MTETAASFFTADHRACDDLWASLEAAVDAGNDAEARRLWESFEGAMLRHFDNEEKVLFPEIEERLGMRGGGPTHVMRIEHEQMRNVLRQMAAEVAQGDLQAMLDHGDTLLMLTQQHNVKEENILYPMADQTLGDAFSELARRLDRG